MSQPALIASATANVPTPPHKRGKGHLPPEIAYAVRQSGVVEEGGDLSWLRDPRMIAALAYADKAHNHKRRNYGGKPRLIHEVWCAHRVFNDTRVKAWLKQEGHDPMMGAFAAAVHDSIENRRALAEKVGVAFRPLPVLRAVERIWGDMKSGKPIVDCVKYMTDVPGLHGSERIGLQKTKSFDAEGRCRVNVLQQAVRAYDKLSHVVFDAREYAAGNISQEQVKECRMQARMKEFAANFPDVPVKAEYAEATQRLHRVPEHLLQPAEERPALTTPQNLILTAFVYNACVLLLNVEGMNRIMDIGRKGIAKSLRVMGFEP